MTTTDRPLPKRSPAATSRSAGSNNKRQTDAHLVSELARRALTESDFNTVLQDALATICRRLDTELAKVLELVPSGEGFLLIAGVGWEPGYVGQVVVPLIPESQAGYTMQLGRAVVVRDLREEKRFRGMPLLHEHGVVGGISTVLRGHTRVHGIISAHSRRKRSFNAEDVAFLDAVASVVAAAMDRRETEEQLSEANQRLTLAMEAGRLGTWEWNPHSGKVEWSEAVEETYGLKPGEFPGTFDAYLAAIHPEDRDFVSGEIARALESGGLEMQYRIMRPEGEVRWLVSRGMVIRDARGQPARMIGICSDETGRREEEMRLAAQYAVTSVLAEANTIPEAISGVLTAICREMDWAVGQMWLLDREAGKLRFSDRCETKLNNPAFPDISSRLTFRSGIGLPGTVLATGESVWISDLAEAHNFPRWKQAAESGLHSGFAFPILLNKDVIGVMEFFSTDHREGSEDFLKTMAIIGSQIGQHIERRRVEEERRTLMFELKAAETRYHSVFEEVKDAILVADSEGRFLDVNAAACDLLAYAQDELLQMSMVDIVAGGEGSPQFADFVNKEEWSGEMELMRKDDSLVTVEARATTINLPSGDVHVSVVRNITQRRAAENSRAFLVQASSILASSLDYDETLGSLARLCVPFMGDWCTVDMFEEEKLRRVAVVHADPAKVDLAEQFRLRFPPNVRADTPPARMLRSGQSLRVPVVTEDIIRAIASDPEMEESLMGLGIKSAMIVPIQARGRTLGLLTLAIAESSRVYTEADQALAEDLGRRAGLAVDNARLYMQSRAAQEELTRANAAKDEFLGLVSHELRTPMTTIHGGARLLRRSWDRIDQESRNEVLGDIEQQTERLQRIVEDLLVLARVELGEEVQKEPVLLQRLIDQTIRAYRKRRPTRMIELYEDPGTPPVDASEIYLEQVLLNLVNNADKYSPHDKPIEIHTEMREDAVVISVLDRGPGIPSEELDRIFERFYRSAGTAQKAAGAGIGLTVCKRLIEALGGTIWAEPREGGGLVVSFSLPAYDERS